MTPFEAKTKVMRGIWADIWKLELGTYFHKSTKSTILDVFMAQQNKSCIISLIMNVHHKIWAKTFQTSHNSRKSVHWFPRYEFSSSRIGARPFATRVLIQIFWLKNVLLINQWTDIHEFFFTSSWIRLEDVYKRLLSYLL